MPRPTPAREVPIKIGPVSDFESFNEPNKYNIVVTMGDRFRIVFRACEDVETDPTYCGGRGMIPQTLDGYVGRAYIRPATGTSLYTELDVEVDETVGSGRITVSADPEITRLLYEHGGVFDVQLSDGTDSFYKTIIIGEVSIIRSITD